MSKITITETQYVNVQVDYNGNTYFKHNNSYYLVSLDNALSEGIVLTKIKNPDYFKKLLVESSFIKSDVKSGTINAGSTTLKGRAYAELNDMTDEEKEDYLEKNDYSFAIPDCKEKQYFWVKYDEDENEDAVFALNGFTNSTEESSDNHGMMYSDILMESTGTFCTILIEGDVGSKRVISNTEKIDGFFTPTLTVYTSGILKAVFIDSEKTATLCLDENGDLIVSNQIKKSN